MPILGESHTEPPYALLTEQNVGKVTVTEVDESGSVPELTVRNTLDVAVYLMDGQELIGTNIAEAKEHQPLAFAGMKVHVLAEGWEFDLASRRVRLPERTSGAGDASPAAEAVADGVQP